MISNPFIRKRRSLVDLVLEALDDIRVEAAAAARTTRDAAAKAADLLGDVAPPVVSRRPPAVAAG
ncbi:MAG: hypothetical protein ABIZ50_08650, partial [Solirubrobacterales bacterium]